jgi:hypothetical protein
VVFSFFIFLRLLHIGLAGKPVPTLSTRASARTHISDFVKKHISVRHRPPARSGNTRTRRRAGEAVGRQYTHTMGAFSCTRDESIPVLSPVPPVTPLPIISRRFMERLSSPAVPFPPICFSRVRCTARGTSMAVVSRTHITCFASHSAQLIFLSFRLGFFMRPDCLSMRSYALSSHARWLGSGHARVLFQTFENK